MQAELALGRTPQHDALASVKADVDALASCATAAFQRDGNYSQVPSSLALHCGQEPSRAAPRFIDPIPVSTQSDESELTQLLGHVLALQVHFPRARQHVPALAALHAMHLGYLLHTVCVYDLSGWSVLGWPVSCGVFS